MSETKPVVAHRARTRPAGKWRYYDQPEDEAALEHFRADRSYDVEALSLNLAWV